MTKTEYQTYRTKPHWLALRRRIRKKRRRCQICGSKQNLEVHHLSYKHIGRERDSELRLLCHYHHMKAHIVWFFFQVPKTAGHLRYRYYSLF